MKLCRGQIKILPAETGGSIDQKQVFRSTVNHFYQVIQPAELLDGQFIQLQQFFSLAKAECYLQSFVPVAMIMGIDPEKRLREVQQLFIMVKTNGLSDTGISYGFQQIGFSTAVGSDYQATWGAKFKFCGSVTAKIIQADTAKDQSL